MLRPTNTFSHAFPFPKQVYQVRSMLPRNALCIPVCPSVQTIIAIISLFASIHIYCSSTVRYVCTTTADRMEFMPKMSISVLYYGYWGSSIHAICARVCLVWFGLVWLMLDFVSFSLVWFGLVLFGLVRLSLFQYINIPSQLFARSSLLRSTSHNFVYVFLSV